MSSQNKGQEMYQRPQYAGGGPEVQQQMGSLHELRMDQEQAAREAQEIRRAQALGGGITFQLGAPGKMFSRVEILAVLRSRKAILEGRQHFDGACRELDALIDIFERME